MPVYYIWGPKGKTTFQVDDDRMSEILGGVNMHHHYNNGSVHGGNGNGLLPPIGGAELSMYQMGYMVPRLPNQNGLNGVTYYEYVWNRPGLPVGATRVIWGTDQTVWITWDHYSVYHRVFQVPSGVHTVFH